MEPFDVAVIDSGGSMKSKEECVVAGGGPAGLEVAALLSKLKPELEPVLFEKEPVVGGRAKTYCINGFWMDHGQHYTILFGEAAAGWPQFFPQPKCAELTGANLVYRSVEPGGVAYMHPAFPGEEINQNRMCPLTSAFDGELVKRLFPYVDDVTLKECEGHCQALLNEMPETYLPAVMAGFDDRKVKQVSVDEWLQARSPSTFAARYMKTMMATNAAVPVEDLGNCNIYGMAAMFIGLNIDLIRYAHPVNPKPPKYGTWAAEVLAFRDVILKSNGRIFTGTPVRRILIENGKVKGVVVEHEGIDQHIETDLVICDIPPHQALDDGILEEREMPEEWVKGIRNTAAMEKDYYSTGYVMASFCLDKPLAKGTFWTIVLDDEGKMVGSLETQRTPESAPPGKQILSIMRWFRLGKVKMNMKIAQEVVNGLLLPHLRLHWKDFDDHVEYCLIHFHPYVWDQVLIYNPEAYTTPIDVPGVDGLYYVGSWTHAGFILTSKCADSALKCAELILGKKLG